MAKYFNISGELTQELLAPGDNVKLSQISLTNVQKVSNCKVDLYIEKKLTGRFYLLKNVELPVGTSLIYNDVTFSNAENDFGLYIKLTDGPTFTLTGTIDVTGANTAVPGTNTLFLSELSVGDEVVVSGETRIIEVIESDTAARVTAAFGSDLVSDASPDCNPTALVDVIIN